MIVVLDTSILVGNFHQTGPEFEVLFGAFDAIEQFRVVVPEVVIDETVAKFREQVAEDYRKAKAASEKLARLIGNDRATLDIPLTLPSDALYRAKLIDRLSQARCDVASYPQVGHKEIVARELSREAPFSQKGTGYRDYLIWLTTLEMVREAHSGEEVILVTANTRDFMRDGKLHPDLRADVPDGADVHAVAALDVLNQRFVRPRLQVVEGAKSKLEGGGLERELESRIASDLVMAPKPLHLDAVVGFLDERQRVTVGRLKVKRISVSEAVQLRGGKVWVAFDATGDISLDIASEVTDFATPHPALRDLSHFEPGEWHWDQDQPFDAQGSLIFDPADGVISESGVNTIDIGGTAFRLQGGVLGPW